MKTLTPFVSCYIGYVCSRDNALESIIIYLTRSLDFQDDDKIGEVGKSGF